MRAIYVVFIFVFVFVSCKNDVLEFSCDPVLNNYVSENKEKLQQLTITELSSSDLTFQQAVFRSFDATKKREIWVNKIQELLATQEYTALESQHLVKLLNYISNDFFEKEAIESQKKERNEFASSWITYAKSNLGWSDKDVAFVIYRLYINKSQFEAELNAFKSTMRQTSTNSECNCNTSASFCAAACMSASCQTSSGCGFFWQQECNGICY